MVIFAHLKIPWICSPWILWRRNSHPVSCDSCSIRGTHNSEENNCQLTQPPLRPNGEWKHSGELFFARKLHLLFTIQDLEIILPIHGCPRFCQFSALLHQWFHHLPTGTEKLSSHAHLLNHHKKSIAVSIIWHIFSPCPLSNKKSWSQQITKITQEKNLEIFDPPQSERINQYIYYPLLVLL